MSTITREFTKEQLQQIIETDHVQCGEASALARKALAAMEGEPHTDDELSNLLWYSQEATCHSDPNYYCEFQRLATPELIAGIIRELQERRKVDSEPVAYMYDGEDGTEYNGHNEFSGGGKGIPLYRHAQPAPVVVPDGLRLALSNAGIAAPESDEMLAATCEKHIQALVTWVKDRKPLQSAPVALEGVLLGAKRWRALLGSARIQILGSAGFDAVVHPGENPDYRHFGMEIWTHYPDWPHEKNEYGINTLTQYADAMLQGGNSPVISDGSADMLRRWLAFGRGMQNAGSQLPHNLIAETESMLAAAPQSPGSEPATVPGKWIPVSERMPDENAEQQVLACFKGGDISTLYYFEGRWDDAYGIVPIRQDVTHWMPLPAAPQEVKGE